MSSPWGGNHCVLGELACARVYSKVDYVFGSILLTITKSFCFRENSTRKSMCSHSLCRESASFTPIARRRKGFFTVVLGSIANRHEMQAGAHKNTLGIHSPLCRSFHNIFFVFSQTAEPNILALVDGPGVSSCQDQTRQTSQFYKQEWWNKREDGTFQVKTAQCFSVV